MKSACVAFPIGCHRNKHNATSLLEYFKENDWALTTDLHKADYLFVSSCGYKEVFEERSKKLLHMANKRKKTNAKLFIFGCLGGANGQRLGLKDTFDCNVLEGGNFHILDTLIDAKIPFNTIDIGFDTTKYHELLYKSYTKIDKILSGDISLTGVYSRTFEKLYNHLQTHKDKNNRRNGKIGRDRDTSVLPALQIRISYGCESTCTYCNIRFAYSKLASNSPQRILQQIEKGIRNGYQVFNLVAEDAGAYGRDINTNIVNLLTEILRAHNKITIEIGGFSPKWLIRYYEQFLPLIAQNYENFQSIYFPIQSGSEKILKNMEREYSVKEAKSCLISLKKQVPNLRLNSHVLIGFPGETEDDFLATIDFLEELKFDKVSVFSYSKRPGTIAAIMPEMLPQQTIKERLRRIKKLNTRTNFIFL